MRAQWLGSEVGAPESEDTSWLCVLGCHRSGRNLDMDEMEVDCCDFGSGSLSSWEDGQIGLLVGAKAGYWQVLVMESRGASW